MPRTRSYKDLTDFTVWAGGYEMFARDRKPQSNVPETPAGFPGSSLEWRVYWWLERKKVDFLFQLDLYGGSVSGGFIVDFLVRDRDPGLVLEVQGKPWHFGALGLRADDRIRKAILLNEGYDVVYLLHSDIDDRLDYTMKEALRGHQLFED
jgi:very-short-patch-repair endonuclease